MAKEAIYGKYKGVNFYGVSQLSFLYWCDCQKVNVANDTTQLYSADRKLKITPIFYLSEFDLHVDIRPDPNDRKIARKEKQIALTIVKNNPNFIFVPYDNIKCLDIGQVVYLSEQSEVDMGENALARLSLLKLKTAPVINAASVGMPRWFRSRLSELRKKIGQD